MLLKIFAFGFVMHETSYLRDLWNVLDFAVVVVGLVAFILENTVSGNSALAGLTALRAFRILRPLRTVKKIEGLRSIMTTIFESIGALGDTVIVLLFFFVIFAIAGLQVNTYMPILIIIIIDVVRTNATTLLRFKLRLRIFLFKLYYHVYNTHRLQLPWSKPE